MINATSNLSTVLRGHKIRVLDGRVVRRMRLPDCRQRSQPRHVSTTDQNTSLWRQVLLWTKSWPHDMATGRSPRAADVAAKCGLISRWPCQLFAHIACPSRYPTILCRLRNPQKLPQMARTTSGGRCAFLDTIVATRHGLCHSMSASVFLHLEYKLLAAEPPSVENTTRIDACHRPRIFGDLAQQDEPAHDAILATSDNLQTFCVDENMVPGPGDASRLEHPRCAQAYHYYHRIELGNTADVSGGTYAHVMRDADASRQVVSIHAGQDHRRYPQFDGAPEYCPIQPLGIQPMHQNSIDSESAVDNSPTVGSVMLCQFRDSGCGQLIPRSSSSAVRRHLTRFHPWLRNLREDCSVLCGWGGWCMETVQFRSLARHIFHKHRPHSGAVCDICGKRLSRLDAVKRHQGSTACYRQLGGTGTYPDMDHVKGTDNLTPTTWILQ